MGLEPASATLTECCVPITPRVLQQCEHRDRPVCKNLQHKVIERLPKAGLVFHAVCRFMRDYFAKIRFLIPMGSVSQAVRSTRRGACPRIFIR